MIKRDNKVRNRYKLSKHNTNYRFTKVFYGTRAEAEAFYAELICKYEKKKGLSYNWQQQKQTFKDLAQIYWDEHGQYTRSSENLKYQLNKIVQHFGPYKACDISSRHLQQYYREILDKTSSTTANKYISTIRAVYNYNIKNENYNGVNPTKFVKKQPDNPGRDVFFPADSISKLLKTINSRSITIIKFSIITGMRRGEVLNLKARDINLTTNQIYLRKTKSGKPRQVPIDKGLRPYLEKRLATMSPDEKLFSLSATQVKNDYNKACIACGWTEIGKTGKIKNAYRWHDLRHTFASHFVMNGGDLTTLKTLLGHSDLSMVMRYAHLQQSYVEEAMNRMKRISDLCSISFSPITTAA